MIMTWAPRFKAVRMVGKAAISRLSLVISPSEIGTLKSSLMRTRFPAKSSFDISNITILPLD
ncbi:protein of unknown function [Pseudodesulfovibrio profundus]|uniref:Uncharacterized protein n=1 Tax=Pseudodesulfovibrio profundus TaxID=57320 RepID=A0A2C8F7U8_9BACT|nr:protein of unknown function [Pseudodesulfovibrio profundus]